MTLAAPPVSRFNGTPAPTFAAALGVFIALLFVYIMTGAPGAWWGDAPELSTAVYTLGVSHETGYPLYMLTGHLLMRLMPWVDPVRTMAVYNAIAVALACALMVPLLAGFLSGRRYALAAATGLALTMGAAHTAWAHATFAEVYPLTLLMAVALVWIASATIPTRQRIIALAFMTGLASTNHYSILALYPLTVATLVVWIRRAQRPLPTAAFAFAAWLAPLLLYVYLPLRARSHPALNWGDPSTPGRLFDYLTCRRYADFSGLGKAHGPTYWLEWWGSQWLPGTGGIAALFFGIALIAVACLFLMVLARKRPVFGSGLLFSIAATLAFCMLYGIPDIDAYFLIALPAAFIGLACCTAWLMRRVTPLVAWIIPPLACVLISFQYPLVDLSHDAPAAYYGQRIMETMPTGAVILAQDDTLMNPVIYEQVVHRRRPDVALVHFFFLHESWYSPYLAQDAPDRVPFRFYPRQPETKIQYDADLVNGILLPAFRAGRHVYTDRRDILFDEFFKPRPGPLLLPPNYKLPAEYSYMPVSSYLLELSPNPQLANMSEAEVSNALEVFYRTRTNLFR